MIRVVVMMMMMMMSVDGLMFVLFFELNRLVRKCLMLWVSRLNYVGLVFV